LYESGCNDAMSGGNDGAQQLLVSFAQNNRMKNADNCVVCVSRITQGSICEVEREKRDHFPMQPKLSS
jgi:hypothetical protein